METTKLGALVQESGIHAILGMYNVKITFKAIRPDILEKTEQVELYVPTDLIPYVLGSIRTLLEKL